jgi:hypothetical protein
VLDASQVSELRDRLNRWLENPDGTSFNIHREIGAIVGVPQMPAREWHFSPFEASRYVQQHARKEKDVPHHVRCQFVKDGIRCRKGEGHERMPNDTGHEEPK